MISGLQIATDVTDMGAKNTSQKAAADESDKTRYTALPINRCYLCSWDITYHAERKPPTLSVSAAKLSLTVMLLEHLIILMTIECQ